MLKKLLVLVLSLALMLTAGGMLLAAEGDQEANSGSRTVAEDRDQEEAVQEEETTEEEEEIEAVEEEDEIEREDEEAEGFGPPSNLRKGKGQEFGRRGLSGLQNAFERVSANGSSVAQRVLSRLIEAAGDVASIAQTLGDLTDEELDELDEAAEEELEAEAEAAMEQAEEDAELAEEDKNNTMKGIGRFYKNKGNSDDAIRAFENAVQYSPKDIETYREIGELYQTQGQEGIKTFVKGKKPNFDVQPRVENGRTLVPFRALGEAFDAAIGWDQDTQTVTFEKADTVVQLSIGELTALVNGQEYQLDVPAFIDNGRTVVPLRFIMEALNANVDYLADTQMIIINE